MFQLSKLTQSTEDFRKYVEPQLYNSGLFNPADSYVVSCEGSTDDLRAKMDMYAGIDMCTIDNKHNCVQGIASRIQYGRCYRSFTIRTITDNGNLETEFMKRATAIKNGDMYPTWTIQAYVYPHDSDDTKLQCTVGVIRTTELFSYIIDQLQNRGLNTWDDFEELVRNDYSVGELDIRRIPGGAIFFSCDWDTIAHHGIDIHILEGVFDK